MMSEDELKEKSKISEEKWNGHNESSNRNMQIKLCIEQHILFKL